MMRYHKYIKRYKKLINYQLLTLTYLSVSILTFINSLKDLNIEVFIYAISKKDKYIFNDVYYIVDFI